MRLYHSTALLLPDATVLTAAGGAPGPVRNLNAEIYYPPYLYDNTGSPAARPTIVAAPQSVHLGQPFQITVGAGDQINRVTFLRVGAATHSFNAEQRFFDLAHSGGQQLTVTPPNNINFAIPGYYMIFVFNQAGVPSIAKIVSLSSLDRNGAGIGPAAGQRALFPTAAGCRNSPGRSAGSGRQGEHVGADRPLGCAGHTGRGRRHAWRGGGHRRR